MIGNARMVVKSIPNLHHFLKSRSSFAWWELTTSFTTDVIKVGFLLFDSSSGRVEKKSNVMYVGVEITNDLEIHQLHREEYSPFKKEMMQVCTIFISSVGSAFSCVALKSNN